MYGCKAEQSIAPTQMLSRWKRHAKQHHQDLWMDKIQSTFLQGYPTRQLCAQNKSWIQRDLSNRRMCWIHQVCDTFLTDPSAVTQCKTNRVSFQSTEMYLVYVMPLLIVMAWTVHKQLTHTRAILSCSLQLQACNNTTNTTDHTV